MLTGKEFVEVMRTGGNRLGRKWRRSDWCRL